jgi:hypothetical protein
MKQAYHRLFIQEETVSDLFAVSIHKPESVIVKGNMR